MLKGEPLAAKFSGRRIVIFWGSFSNLGIERAVIGDILVQKHTAWIFCHEKITQIYHENLTRRSYDYELSMVDVGTPEPEFGDQWHMCFRTRLDALIGLAFRLQAVWFLS